MAGQDVDSKAQDVLKDKGFAVTVWPLYAAKAATDFPSEALSFFRASTERAILVFSPRTAQTLVELIVQSGLTPACAELTILGLSAAVVKPLAALVWKNCVAVDPPTEAAVLAALTTYHPIL